MSFDFGDIGSGIGDFFTNTVPSWFGAGDASTPTAPVVTPSADTSGASSFGSSFGNFLSPSADLSSGAASAPAATNNSSQITSFLNGGSPAPTTTTSAASAPSLVDNGNGQGNTNSIVSTANTPVAPSTLQQITSALGLGNTSPGDVLKGAIGAGGLAYSAINNAGSTSAEKALKGQAATQSAQGQQLETYLANGTLPPGAQAYVDQQTAAQKAAIQSKYAALGMSGSTAEIQELNNVDAQATSQMFQIASQLYSTGVTETGASSQLYDLLMNAQNADNAQIGNAISTFVSALGGGTTPQKGTISFG